MAEVEFILAGIPVFLSMFIPGLLLALPLLQRSRLSLFEKCVFGFILGMVIPPTLLTLLSLAGIGYSFTLMLAVLAFTTLVGLFLNFAEVSKGGIELKVGAIKELMGASIDFEKKEDVKRAGIAVALLLIMVWAFWARMQSLSPTFYEFDPYYYLLSTKWILTDGQIPLRDMTAWYPYGSSHRLAPLTNYLEAQWYSIYTQGVGFDLDTLTLVGNVYPPLVGALLCFLLFMVAKEEWGVPYGLAAAALGATLPRILMKFAAGEAELQPFGIFALFFFAASYSLMLHRKGRRLALLAGIAAMSVIIGSQYFIILMLVYGGYLGMQATFDFLRGKDLREFLEMNAYIVAAIFIASLIIAVHIDAGLRYMLDKPMILIAILAYGYGLQYVRTKISGAEEKSYALLGLFVLGGILLLATGLSDRLVTAVNSAAGFATQTTPLFMTVAEESPTAGEFSGSFDLLGYSLFDTSGTPFTLIHLTLFLAAFAIAYGVYRDSKMAIMLALLIFPISWVGLQKSKYVLQLGFMLILALMAVFGELQRFLAHSFKDAESQRNAKTAVVGCMVLFTLLAVFEPSINPFQLKGTPAELASVKAGSQYWQNGSANCTAIGQAGFGTAYYLYCDVMPAYWTEPMAWISNSTEPDARIVSWWDYGHWINYFGERDSLTRGEHAHMELDLMVADKFVFGPRDNNESGEADLAQFMREYKANYILMDYDLIAKWGALDFLACVHNNQTNMTYAKASGLGTSECEKLHNFEHVLIPLQRGAADYCISPVPNVTLVRAQSTFGYTYCVAEEMQGEYSVPKFMVYEDNMSKQNFAMLSSPQLTTFGGKDYAVYTAIYPEEGYGDRKGRFYDSPFYKGFILGKLDGFDIAYEYRDPGSGQLLVRIFKLKG